MVKCTRMYADRRFRNLMFTPVGKRRRSIQIERRLTACLKTLITKRQNITIMPLRPIGRPLNTMEKEIIQPERSTRQRLTSTPRKLTKLRKLPTRNRRSRNKSVFVARVFFGELGKDPKSEVLAWAATLCTGSSPNKSQKGHLGALSRSWAMKEPMQSGLAAPTCGISSGALPSFL
jgi:hypothetical protein